LERAAHHAGWQRHPGLGRCCAAGRTALSGRGRARGAFDAAEIRLFRAEGHQGVHYRKGVWHHFLLALDAASDFLVVDRAGPGANCQEVELASSDEIRVRS
jgi:ureidoglycolate lyase